MLQFNIVLRALKLAIIKPPVWVLRFILDLFMMTQRKKWIVFVVQNELMFQYAYEIYKIIYEDEQLNIMFCFALKKRFLSYGKIRKNYSVKSMPLWIARHLKWHLILFPCHFERNFRKESQKIYSEHALPAGKKINGESYAYGSLSLDKNGQVIYQKIFISSHHAADLIKEYYPLFYPHVRVVGSLLLDKLSNRADQVLVPKKDPDKKTIMFVSTWGLHSLIQAQGINLVEEMLRLSEHYNLILSPHFHNYHSNKKWPVDMREIEKQLAQTNVFVVQPNSGSNGTLSFLADTDLLITDSTSVCLYYPQFCRPIIYYNNSDVQYTKYSLMIDLKEISYSVSEIKNMKWHINCAFDQFSSEAMRVFAEKVSSYPGKSEARYKEEIYDSLNFLDKLIP